MSSSFSAFLLDPEVPATVLLVGLLDEFGTEMFDWEPDTLNLEIRDKWKVEVPQVNRDKIWALITAITTDLFLSSFEGFTNICNSLAGSGASFQVYDPATVQEMAWAISEITLVAPLEKDERFNKEILIYMEERLKLEGFSKPPRILASFVTDLDDETRVNESLSMDGIDFKAYWDSQVLKRLEVDEMVRTGLLAMLRMLGQLEFTSVDQKALRELTQRAEKALAEQSQATQAAAESVAARPSL